MFYKYISLVLFIFILNGCVKPTSKDPALSLAKKQADKIRQHLPIKSDHYMLIMAHHQANTINMIFMQEQSDEFTTKPEPFLAEYKKQLCASKKILDLLRQGGSYQITINGLENRSIAKMGLFYGDCKNTGQP